MKFTSYGADDTFRFAFDFAKRLNGGEIVTLAGELGAGKTVFAKGLCAGLGVKEDVLSPTFTVMNDYTGAKLKVCHYDAYRLSSAEEAYYSGLTEYFGDSDTVCLIEWAENIKGALDGFDVREVKIERIDDDKREIEIK